MENLEQTITTISPNWENLSFWQKVKNLFRGRMGRKHYFISVVCLSLAVLPASFVIVFITDFLPQSLAILPILLLLLIVQAYSVSINIRRLHDMDISALWLIPLYILYYLIDFIRNESFAFYISIAGFVAVLVIFLRSGTNGTNRFGHTNSLRSFKDVLLNRDTENHGANREPADRVFKFERRYLKIYFIITFIFAVAITYSHHNFLDNNLSSSSYEETPEEFQFILFPNSDEVQLYSDRKFKEKIGTINRAVMVSGDEMKEGVVEVNIKTNEVCGVGYVKLDELTLLPPSNTDYLIMQTNDLYDKCNLAARFTWSAEAVGENQYRVEYANFSTTIMKDDSSSIYGYITNGNIIVKADPVQDFGVIKTIALLSFDIPLFSILMGLAWFISRFIFVRDN